MNFITLILAILIQFGFIVLKINSINLGLISQIEVVEEWGCHDTEIRLTCGHLDSKLAILEATFTPNCTNEDCLRLDIKRLVKVFHSTPKPSSSHRHHAETEAGRKFLESLRKAPHESGVDDEEVVVIEEEENDLTRNKSTSSKTSSEEISIELHNHHHKNLNPDHLIARKTSLRASLERLIIRYLRKLSPEDNFDYDFRKRSLRTKRSRRKRVKKSSGSSEPSVRPGEPEKSLKIASHRIELGSANIIVNETTTDFSEMEAEELEKRRKESRSFCPEQQRRVTSLNRYDLEHSFRNETFEQYNIRRVLNKRCSGKNHCSFLFNLDHPFSKVWESGIVRIKYICMEDFRINRYCGEHLSIAYELSPQEQLEQFNNDAKVPLVAEALRDVAYHSVKILKNSEEDIDMPSHSVAKSQSNESRKRKIKIHNPQIKQEKMEDQKGVYSQDFRVLKILPSNLDDFNNLEKIGNEIYFRKDKDILEQPSDIFEIPEHNVATDDHSELFPTAPASQEHLTTFQATQLQPTPPSVPSSPSIYLTSEGTVVYYPAPHLDNNNFTTEDINLNINQNLSKFENYTLTIREGEQYILVYSQTPPPESKSSNNNDTKDSFLLFDNLKTSINKNFNEIPSNLFANKTVLNSTILPTTSKSSTEDDYLTSATVAVLSPPTLNITANANISTTIAFNDSINQILTSSTSTIVAALPQMPTSTTAPFSTTSASKSNDHITTHMQENDIDGPLPTASQLLTTTRQSYDMDNMIELPESKSYDEDDSIDDSDDSSENDDDLLYPTRRTYTSIQRTAFRGPLLHGFIMTPGYPKFYIGESECKWLIKAPIGNKIIVSIFDISLRYEDGPCVDYIKIVDTDVGTAIFNSCTEDIRPIEVVSFSNQIEVVVKTKTKFAYPKRGILLHYSAVGCVLPPLPKYVHLVHKTETTANYECDSTYVFPDTGETYRQLTCTDKHTWNKILPDCIEEHLIVNSKGLFITNSRKRPPDIDENSSKMGDKDADMYFDILIPICIITALFVVNGVIVAVIMKYRRRNKNQMEVNGVELAEL